MFSYCITPVPVLPYGLQGRIAGTLASASVETGREDVGVDVDSVAKRNGHVPVEDRVSREGESSRESGVAFWKHDLARSESITEIVRMLFGSWELCPHQVGELSAQFLGGCRHL
jgi:hypothetical protein